MSRGITLFQQGAAVETAPWLPHSIPRGTFAFYTCSPVPGPLQGSGPTGCFPEALGSHWDFANNLRPSGFAAVPAARKGPGKGCGTPTHPLLFPICPAGWVMLPITTTARGQARHRAPCWHSWSLIVRGVVHRERQSHPAPNRPPHTLPAPLKGRLLFCSFWPTADLGGHSFISLATSKP